MHFNDLPVYFKKKYNSLITTAKVNEVITNAKATESS